MGVQKLHKRCIQEVSVASGQSTKQHWVNTNEEYVSEQKLSRAHVYQEPLYFHSKREKKS